MSLLTGMVYRTTHNTKSVNRMLSDPHSEAVRIALYC